MGRIRVSDDLVDLTRQEFKAEARRLADVYRRDCSDNDSGSRGGARGDSDTSDVGTLTPDPALVRLIARLRTGT